MQHSSQNANHFNMLGMMRLSRSINALQGLWMFKRIHAEMNETASALGLLHQHAISFYTLKTSSASIYPLTRTKLCLARTHMLRAIFSNSHTSSPAQRLGNCRLSTSAFCTPSSAKSRTAQTNEAQTAKQRASEVLHAPFLLEEHHSRNNCAVVTCLDQGPLKERS